MSWVDLVFKSSVFFNKYLLICRTFGEIKALRMPKKVNPGSESHRGFAFVDFVTESDAKVIKLFYIYDTSIQVIYKIEF